MGIIFCPSYRFSKCNFSHRHVLVTVIKYSWPNWGHALQMSSIMLKSAILIFYNRFHITYKDGGTVVLIFVDMHRTSGAPVLSLPCICHGYFIPGQRKMIQQKLNFLISMLQELIFIFRAVHSFRKIVIVSMEHSWSLKCPGEDTLSTKSQLFWPCISDALLSSHPIRLLQENVSSIT